MTYRRRVRHIDATATNQYNVTVRQYSDGLSNLSIPIIYYYYITHK